MKMEYVELGEVLIYEQPTKYIVKSTNYDDTFKTPVLTAGQSFILGYTDEIENIFDNVPVIIFDDFTTAIKYVDFPFKVKSSAMKILKADSNKADIRFLYYLLLTIKVNSAQHKRYWISKFSKIKIPLPPLEEQQRIARLLDEADRLRQLDKALIEKYDALTQSLFLDMFGDPVTNPKGWEKVELGSLGKISSGSTPSRKIAANFKGKIPWVKTGEVNGEIIFDTEEKISTEGLKNSSCKLNPINSLIIAMYGQGKTRGQVGILGIESATNQACAVIPPSVQMNQTFLFIQLKFCYHDLRNLSRGGNQSNLNVGLIKKYKCIFPDLHLQNQFAERVAIIEQQKQQAQEALQKSEDLFNGLLQDVFR